MQTNDMAKELEKEQEEKHTLSYADLKIKNKIPPCFNNTAKGHGERYNGNFTSTDYYHYGINQKDNHVYKLNGPPKMGDRVPGKKGQKIHGGVIGERDDDTKRVVWH